MNGRFTELIVRALAALGLVIASPLWAVIAIAVIADSGWPILFRQNRVGRFRKPFQLLKFRSMRTQNTGTRVTAQGDPRLTRVGRILRKYKLDEIPQLWNVVKGDMAIIGPRPEVPAFVDSDDPQWHSVLQVRPGITSLASLIYRNEEEVLSRYADPERAYREVIVPDKLKLTLDYIASRTPWTDVQVLWLTVRYSIWPSGFDSQFVRRKFQNASR